MTLIEAVDAARALLNEPLASSRTFPDNTSSFWTDGILTSYHNLIQQEVQQEVIQVFEDYFVTQSFLGISAAVAEYTLPSRFIKIRRLEDARDITNPTEITPVRLNDRSTMGSNLRDNQTPVGSCGYYIRGNQIILTDTPTFTDASAIRMHYVARIPDVTAGSDSSEIPAEHHRVLVWGIVKLALFQQQSDTTLANQEFEKHMMKIKQQAENRQIQRPRRVVRTGGSD